MANNSGFVCDKPHSGQANFRQESSEGCMDVECRAVGGKKIRI